AICQKSRAIETLPEGASYSILNIDDESYTDNTAVFTEPEGNLFFMGDNRDNSADSRFSQAGGGLGFVPMSNVLGKAQYVIFSSAGTSMVDFASWRAERFWAAVK
ncbi:MAG: S26 family signal peptidase, partial [Microgenomates group bacterium]